MSTATLPNPPSPNVESAGRMIQLVTFTVGDVQLAIDIAHVQEINRSLDVTPVPEASPMIHGVVNLRGDVVTVINPHRLLNLPVSADRRRGRNLILNLDGERIGVLVDSVSDVLTLSSNDLSRRPKNIRSIDRRFISSVVLRDADLIVVLDPAGLIAAIDE